MKSLWRKIAFISAWVILVLGLVGSIVYAVQTRSFGVFCSLFIPAAFYFTILMLYLEHSNNIEMRVDQTYRKQNNLPQLPESAYTNIPFNSAPSVPAAPAAPYQQPVQPQYQQPAPAPVQQFQQPAPVQQPAPAPVPTPAPAPVQQPAPAPVPQPATEAPWTCANCGTVNNPSANFCKGCGNKKA
ncbi:MAG: hypothetical protein ACI4JZ_03645 [Oscillospiraceae bacterium]